MNAKGPRNAQDARILAEACSDRGATVSARPGAYYAAGRGPALTTPAADLLCEVLTGAGIVDDVDAAEVLAIRLVAALDVAGFELVPRW